MVAPAVALGEGELDAGGKDSDGIAGLTDARVEDVVVLVELVMGGGGVYDAAGW